MADALFFNTMPKPRVANDSVRRPAAPSSRVQGHLASSALILGIAALILLFVYSDAGKLWEATSTIEPWLLAIPMLCSLASYVVMALSYQGIARGAGAEVPFWEMFKITLVANTVNYLVSTGGLSGFAVRMYFFIRNGVRSSTAVMISLVQTLITNTVLMLFVGVGFAYLFQSGNLQGVALVSAGVMLVAALGLVAGTVVLLMHRQWRRRTLFVLAETANWLLHRLLPSRKPARVRIWRFQRNLNQGIEFLIERKHSMILPTLWIFLDWAVTILILWSAFVAVGYPIAMSWVVVGFAVGIILSMISLVPGGLGVMEGSMAAIFAGLGVPFETAVVAVLIYRLAYYVLPMITSLFFFRAMLVQGAFIGAQEDPQEAVDKLA